MSIPAASSSKENGSLPKITVVTPSFNQGQFLETCLTSVLNQAYPNLQYIVIDGGSSDDSVEIIKKYESHLSYWVSEPDAGQSEAINKGFRRASGEIVAWLNSDDFYLPGALMEAAQAYQIAPEAPFHFGDGLRVNQYGQPLRPFFPHGSLRFSYEALRYGLNYILQPATFIRRESLDTIDYVSTKLHYGMDTDLWLRLSALGEPNPIQVKIAASREYGQTKTSSGSFSRVEELRQIAEQHTGLPITPGTICYFLDTLYRLAEEHPEMFPAKYRRDILHFWGETSLIMDRFGAGPDGFPLAPKETTSAFERFKRAGWVRLRNFIKGRPFLARKFLDG